MDAFCCSRAFHVHSRSIRRGLVVRISAFHAGGPGSIPGVGILFLLLSKPCTSPFLCSIRKRKLISHPMFYSKKGKKESNTRSGMSLVYVCIETINMYINNNTIQRGNFLFVLHQFASRIEIIHVDAHRSLWRFSTSARAILLIAIVVRAIALALNTFLFFMLVDALPIDFIEGRIEIFDGQMFAFEHTDDGQVRQSVRFKFKIGLGHRGRRIGRFILLARRLTVAGRRRWLDDHPLRSVGKVTCQSDFHRLFRNILVVKAVRHEGRQTREHVLFDILVFGDDVLLQWPMHLELMLKILAIVFLGVDKIQK